MSVNIALIGRIVKDPTIMFSQNNPDVELMYLRVAVDTHGYKDKQNNGQWVQKTSYCDVQLRYQKGELQNMINNGMFQKGHMLEVKNLGLLQRPPRVDPQSGIAYPNNLYILLPYNNVRASIEFYDYPHAVKSNASQPAPKQTPAQSAQQQGVVTQGSQAGTPVNTQGVNQGKNPSEPPAIDFDDDVPF